MSDATNTELTVDGLHYTCPAEWAADALAQLDGQIAGMMLDGEPLTTEAADFWARAWAHLVEVNGGERQALADLFDIMGDAKHLDTIVFTKRAGWVRTKILTAD